MPHFVPTLPYASGSRQIKPLRGWLASMRQKLIQPLRLLYPMSIRSYSHTAAVVVVTRHGARSPVINVKDGSVHAEAEERKWRTFTRLP